MHCWALVLGFVLLLASSAHADVGVSGNQLTDNGAVTRLLGVNRSGTEYACIQGWGIFDGPNDQASITAMRSWDINRVRVPLNEDCWLGINGVNSAYGGAAYRQAIESYVALLEANHLGVILDLHVAAAGTAQSVQIIRMPDADHAPAFWASVASTFKSDHQVLFDLYNEPHDVSWPCWVSGCAIPSYTETGGPVAAYQAAGMQDLVNAVRGTGATQPIMVGGLGWSGDLSQWLAYRPTDPANQLVASEHNYGGLSDCTGSCQDAIAQVKQSFPVVVGELGETDCATDYIDPWMSWADSEGLSYLGWTWNSTSSGWDCAQGPALISEWDGTPTAYGVGFRDHFRALATQAPPIGPPAKLTCRVPRLIGRRLRGARRLARASHCRLRVTSHRRHGRVRSQRPRAGSERPAGTLIKVRLR